MGTKDSLNPNLANGHEARSRIAARDTANDPANIVERVVETRREYLGVLVQQVVFEADRRILTFSDPDHNLVKNNYVQGNKCGEAWVFSPDSAQYFKIQIRHQLPNGQFVCI
jgi:hypothetical protein